MASSGLSKALKVVVACLEAGNCALAERLCREIVAEHADAPGAHHLYGIALLRLGRITESLAHLKRAACLAPAAPEIRNDFGTLLYRIGRLDDAVAAFTEAIAIRPSYVEGRVNLALALEQSGRALEAAEQCSRAIELRPNYAQAHAIQSEAL